MRKAAEIVFASTVEGLRKQLSFEAEFSDLLEERLTGVLDAHEGRREMRELDWDCVRATLGRPRSAPTREVSG